MPKKFSRNLDDSIKDFVRNFHIQKKVSWNGIGQSL